MGGPTFPSVLSWHRMQWHSGDCRHGSLRHSVIDLVFGKACSYGRGEAVPSFFADSTCGLVGAQASPL